MYLIDEHSYVTRQLAVDASLVGKIPIDELPLLFQVVREVHSLPDPPVPLPALVQGKARLRAALDTRHAHRFCWLPLASWWRGGPARAAAAAAITALTTIAAVTAAYAAGARLSSALNGGSALPASGTHVQLPSAMNGPQSAGSAHASAAPAATLVTLTGTVQTVRAQSLVVATSSSRATVGFGGETRVFIDGRPAAASSLSAGMPVDVRASRSATGALTAVRIDASTVGTGHAGNAPPVTDSQEVISANGGAWLSLPGPRAAVTPAAPIATTLARLHLEGVIVASSADALTVRTRAGERRAQILGATVIRLPGPDNMAGLAVGMRVQIEAVEDARGGLLALRIEAQATGTPTAGPAVGTPPPAAGPAVTPTPQATATPGDHAHRADDRLEMQATLEPALR